jgi:hypothetical protein
MQAKLGQTLCSALTDVAVDNFASRLDQMTCSISEQSNAGRATDDLNRFRRRFVLRVYKLEEELKAFKSLLEKPESVDTVDESGRFFRQSSWKLPLSLAYWLLVLLQSKAVPALHPDASPKLHELQKEVDKSDALSKLRDVGLCWNSHLT